MRIEGSTPALVTQSTQSVEPVQRSGWAWMEVRREPGLTYSYVARDAQGSEIWRFPHESVFAISSLSEKKPPGFLLNIKA